MRRSAALSTPCATCCRLSSSALYTHTITITTETERETRDGKRKPSTWCCPAAACWCDRRPSRTEPTHAVPSGIPPFPTFPHPNAVVMARPPCSSWQRESVCAFVCVRGAEAAAPVPTASLAWHAPQHQAHHNPRGERGERRQARGRGEAGARESYDRRAARRALRSAVSPAATSSCTSSVADCPRNPARPGSVHRRTPPDPSPILPVRKSRQEAQQRREGGRGEGRGREGRREKGGGGQSRPGADVPQGLPCWRWRQ